MGNLGARADYLLIALFSAVFAFGFISIVLKYDAALELSERGVVSGKPRIIHAGKICAYFSTQSEASFEVKADGMRIRSKQFGSYSLRPYKLVHLKGVEVRRKEGGVLRDVLTAKEAIFDPLDDTLTLTRNVVARSASGDSRTCRKAIVDLAKNRIGIQR